MTEHVEREPAPRRQATYPGDHRHLLGDGQWLGPDRRGILWRPCHADYNLAKNQTVVIFAPVAPHEVDRVPGSSAASPATADPTVTAHGPKPNTNGYPRWCSQKGMRWN